MVTLSWIKYPGYSQRKYLNIKKHQVGGVWNEVSRRYVTDEPEFFMPDYWRKKADNVKQGSSNEEVTVLGIQGFKERDPTAAAENLVRHSLDLYEDMLEAGICAEQARMILPQNMMTEWIWTGSLMFFYRVCKDRLGNTAQKETQEVADYIYSICEDLFPVSWKALMENR